MLQIPLKDIDLNDTSAYKPLEQVFVGEKAQKLIVIYLAVKLRIFIVHARNSGLHVRPMQ